MVRWNPSPIYRLGGGTLAFADAVGQLLHLLWASLYWLKAAPRSLKEIFRQMSLLGVNSLPIASVMALFVGMVLALQTGSQLLKFRQLRALDLLGPIVGLSMVAELGPVMTAYLLAGRVGSAITAEIGTMQVTEEIDALRVAGINPVRFLAMPRIVAATTMLPMLVIYAELIGVLGGALVSATYLGVSAASYFDNLMLVLKIKDIVNGLIKAFVFGIIVSSVGCWQGFATQGGAAGVGRTTTRSVVISFMLILIADYFMWRILP